MAEHQEHSTKRQIVNFSGKPALMRHLSRDTPTRKLANKHHCQLIQNDLIAPSMRIPALSSAPFVHQDEGGVNI